MTEAKIVLITAPTRLESLVTRFNTVSQTRFYVEHMGSDFSDYQKEHDRYHLALETLKRSLGTFGRLQLLTREFLPNFVFGPDDVVAVLGRDGLLVNALKYLSGQPLIGVNPDPERWDGVLVPFAASEAARTAAAIVKGSAEVKEITMAKASLSDGQSLLAVNDFFIGAKSHISARYLLTQGPVSEPQSSSGIIVSTGLGSSGWLKSVVTGARAIAGFLRSGDQKVSFSKKNSSEVPDELQVPWDADYLYFSVREPFPSRSSRADLVFGRVDDGSPLIIQSQMPEKGVIFSDGVEDDFLQFASGTTATIALASHKGRVVRKTM